MCARVIALVRTAPVARFLSRRLCVWCVLCPTERDTCSLSSASCSLRRCWMIPFLLWSRQKIRCGQLGGALPLCSKKARSTLPKPPQTATLPQPPQTTPCPRQSQKSPTADGHVTDSWMETTVAYTPKMQSLRVHWTAHLQHHTIISHTYSSPHTDAEPLGERTHPAPEIQ